MVNWVIAAKQVKRLCVGSRVALLFLESGKHNFIIIVLGNKLVSKVAVVRANK